jgi:hypothetical protein
MTWASRVVRRTAFGLMVAVTVLFGLFAAGYAFEDPGGWQAFGIVAAVVVPMLALTFVAYRWPQVATVLLALGLVLVATLAVLDTQGEGGRELVRQMGPVSALNLLMLGVPMATLGLRRPLAGGLLVVGTGLAAYLPYLPMVVREGIALGASLTWSSTVLVVPFLVIGGMLLVAALLEGRPASPGSVAPQPEPAASRQA